MNFIWLPFQSFSQKDTTNDEKSDIDTIDKDDSDDDTGAVKPCTNAKAVSVSFHRLCHSKNTDMFMASYVLIFYYFIISKFVVGKSVCLSVLVVHSGEQTNKKLE